MFSTFFHIFANWNILRFVGECECDEEFGGKTCECSNSMKNCIAPDSTQICSGRGTCDCNQCKCDSSSFGTFCESSPGNESVNALCIFYEPCVQCVINRKLERECSDFKERCSSKDKNLYKSEFYDDISGKGRALFFHMRYSMNLREALCLFWLQVDFGNFLKKGF